MTLDDDVAAKLAAEAKRTGRPYRSVVNEAIRAGLETRRRGPNGRYRVRARKMGLRPGVSLDSISALIDALDGPSAR